MGGAGQPESARAQTLTAVETTVNPIPRPAAPRRPALRTPARGGTPEALARAAHWQIAALHHIRDVTMKEDAQGLRAGTSAQVAASLRNTSIAALRLAGFTSAAARRRWAARNPLRPLTILNLIQRERP